jgi:hypothetical protein
MEKSRRLQSLSLPNAFPNLRDLCGGADAPIREAKNPRIQGAKNPFPAPSGRNAYLA